MHSTGHTDKERASEGLQGNAQYGRPKKTQKQWSSKPQHIQKSQAQLHLPVCCLRYYCHSDVHINVVYVLSLCSGSVRSCISDDTSIVMKIFSER